MLLTKNLLALATLSLCGMVSAYHTTGSVAVSPTPDLSSRDDQLAGGKERRAELEVPTPTTWTTATAAATTPHDLATTYR
ncbi:hypothetical protein F4775DRAFT_590727 [Biscogniauxia sp. FL1348]|nr:hypothetical protein F4775DRAFT_590727 [Biscogniauxia sp. FL1348]